MKHHLCVVFACACFLLCALSNALVFASSTDLVKQETYSDNFETPACQAKGIGVKLNPNWKSFSRYMGWDNKATFGINSSISGISSSLAKMEGQFLYLEARAEDMSYNSIPTILYTGTYPSTPGYKVNVEVKTGTGNRGAGIRFMVSEDESFYYELYFPGDEYNSSFIKTILNKVSLGIDGKPKRDILYVDYGTSKADTIRGSVIYNMHLSVYNGDISYSITPKDGYTSTFSAVGRVIDTTNPYTFGNVGFITGGGGSKYAMFDNFEISSYDYFVEEKNEPNNVIYKQEPIKSINNNVIELYESTIIRRIDSTPSNKVELSPDGINFISLGSALGSKLINTVTNNKYKFIRVSNASNVKVYSEASSSVNIPLYSSSYLLGRINGVDATSVAYNSNAISESSFKVSAIEKYNTYVPFALMNDTGIYTINVRIVKPYDYYINSNKVTFISYLPNDVSFTNPIVCFKYFNKANELIKCVYAFANIQDGVLNVEADYLPTCSYMSATLTNGISSLYAPFGEWVLR